MLSNAYLLAKFRFDTIENEPSKVCPFRCQASDGCFGWRRLMLSNAELWAAGDYAEGRISAGPMPPETRHDVFCKTNSRSLEKISRLVYRSKLSSTINIDYQKTA